MCLVTFSEINETDYQKEVEKNWTGRVEQIHALEPHTDRGLIPALPLTTDLEQVTQPN